MRALVQRVASASVVVGSETVGSITGGLLVYVAAASDDTDADVQYVADKVAGLRIFSHADGKMNLDVSQSGGAILLVSAFTVLADARKGRRPSFDASASGTIAEPLVARLADELRARDLRVETGRFAADMLVRSVNDGPICILLDSRRLL